MKKFAAIVLLIACSIAILSGCGEGRPAMTGRCLVTANGQYLIIGDDNGEPTVMCNQSGKANLFDELQTGDKIKITYDRILLTYPSQTNAYGCKIIERGSLADIPQDIYDQLTEMGWIFE